MRRNEFYEQRFSLIVVVTLLTQVPRYSRDKYKKTTILAFLGDPFWELTLRVRLTKSRLVLFGRIRVGAGPDSAPAPRKILCIDYFAPTNQRKAWTRVGWTGVSWIRVLPNT